MELPRVIQGGMGVAVSSWRLARAVSMEGQLGVVSGTGLDTVLARRLQNGDRGGHMRHGLDHFPNKEAARRIIERYFVESGKPAEASFKSKPLPALKPSAFANELIVAANFVEVFLAKEGHSGLVGINLLEKIQLPTIPSLFGAMLAGVDYVLMGAGIPRAIPRVLDDLAALNPSSIEISVTGSTAHDPFLATFDPKSIVPGMNRVLMRPSFLAIISSSALALTLARKCTSPVQGFIVEGPSAGGHNAPPRGAVTLDENGEPIYGPRDEPDLDQIKSLGLPFWLAGSYGSPEGLRHALELGATGIQVGTAFAYCEESGLDPEFKRGVIEDVISSSLRVRTDPYASPTGFPFKVLERQGTLSEESVYESRERICDLGYLREAYLTESGSVGHRCPGEPVEDYVRKGGDPANCKGRKCICNGLLAAIGLGQIQKGTRSEPALLTVGDDVNRIAKLVNPETASYSARNVLDFLLGDGAPAETCPA